jgi:hypothetical protein
MNHLPPASFAAHLRNHSETCPVARAIVRLRRFGRDALFGSHRVSLPDSSKPRDVATAKPANDASPASHQTL